MCHTVVGHCTELQEIVSIVNLIRCSAALTAMTTAIDPTLERRNVRILDEDP